jgi:O-antigen ligase
MNGRLHAYAPAALPPAPRLSQAEVWRRLLLGAPLVAVGFAIWAFGGVYGWAYGIAYLLIFSTLAVWGWRCASGRMAAHWRPIYLPMLLFGAWGAVQLDGGMSVVPAATATALLHLGAAGALFLLISQTYAGNADADGLACGFSVFTAALALLAILENLTASRGVYWTFTYAYASPAGSFVNRDHFAGCMEMLLPLAVVAAYRRRRRPWLEFLPWAAPPALGVAAMVLTASRGGLMALGAELAAGLAVLVYLERRGGEPARRAARRERRSRWVALWVLGGMTASLVLMLGTQRLQRRLDRLPAFGPSLAQRADLNASSMAMFRSRPWGGWGLGTWAYVYPAYARFDDGTVYAYAHNDYLQLLAETGLAGAALAALFWILWGWDLLGRLRRWPPALLGTGLQAPPALPMAVAAGLGCVGLLVHSWVDFNLHIPANLLLFFGLAALALPPEGDTGTSR